MMGLAIVCRALGWPLGLAGATSKGYQRAVARVLGRMRQASWVRREIATAPH